MLIEHSTLDVTAEVLRENIGWKSAISLQGGLVDGKFQVEGVTPTNHSSSQKTRLNDISYGIKIWTDLASFLSQSTCLTDRQTDRRTEFSSLDRVCILQRSKNQLQYYLIWGKATNLGKNGIRRTIGLKTTFSVICK